MLTQRSRVERSRAVLEALGTFSLCAPRFFVRTTVLPARPEADADADGRRHARQSELGLHVKTSRNKFVLQTRFI